MIVYSSPGVYVQEVPAGPQPVAAAPTSVLAVVGSTERGPLREPTRVTGWAGFREVFGHVVEGLHTAEAVYGYFENGGPAVHVVRVDPSTAAEWDVLQDDGATRAFTVVAASPGGWAGDLEVHVFPDFTAGAGRLFTTEVVSVATNLNAGSAARTVGVGSTAGLRPGDPVAVVTGQAPTGGAIAPGAATVTSVDHGASTVTLAVTTTGTFAAGRTHLAAVVPAGAVSAALVTGGGIRRGDVLRFVTGRRSVASAVVERADPAQPGLSLVLSGGPAAAVPGLQFAPRVERFAGVVASPPGGRTLPLSGITGLWDRTSAPSDADLAPGHTATAANGLVGTWDPGTSSFGFAGDVPAGPVQVEVAVSASAFRQAVALTDPTEAQLAQSFGVVPLDGRLRLVRDDPSATATLTRTADGFTTTDSLAGTWDRVEAPPPADPTQGVLVQCPVEPRRTDFLGTGASTALPLASVERITAGLYLLRTDGTGTLGAGPWPLRTFVPTEVVPHRFAVSVVEAGVAVETYRGLALHPDHPGYYLRDDQVDEVSTRIRVTERPAGAPVTAAAVPAVAVRRRSGTDAVASPADLAAGFALLERTQEPAMVACPDAVTLDETGQAAVLGAMLTHCEEFRRFAVVDAPPGLSETALADWRLRTVNSAQAAVYAPWLKVLNLDPSSPRRLVEVPPSGFVAGVFARTDRDRGVHKAPANERVRGIVGLAVDYTTRQQDLLNPAGVNLLRTFPGRGTRIWGARSATDDVQWRYVNVRRLFNLIEHSVERTTQWVVFEPNTASTWLRIRVSVEDFLDALYRSGALAGTSPEQAYRVRVGLGETMTEHDVDLGLVVTEVAVAPAKPAEFVVFRFSHKRITE